MPPPNLVDLARIGALGRLRPAVRVRPALAVPDREPDERARNGYYLGDTFEARFGSGIGFIRKDPSDGGLPSAHGLQRLTNFNRPFVISGGNTMPVMPISNAVPSIFVSQEDVVWVEAPAVELRSARCCRT